MILREATIKYKKYDPDKLGKGSNKRVCISCDKCGRVKYIAFKSYKNLYLKCSSKQKNQPPKTKIIPNEKDRFIPNTNIDRIETIKKYGYDPIDLKEKSHKFVCVICDNCKKYKNVKRYACYLLCKSCSTSGKNNPMFGSCRIDEKSPHWRGGDITLICEICGDKFDINKSRKNIAKFCSQECYNKWMSENQNGENNPNWQGGIAGNRDHVKHECNYIKINSKIKSFEGHHIMSGVIIYIPKYLHRSIYHNMKNGQGIKEINNLALNYLLGDY